MAMQEGAIAVKHKLILLGIYTISACASVSIMWLVWTWIFWLMEKMK